MMKKNAWPPSITTAGANTSTADSINKLSDSYNPVQRGNKIPPIFVL